MKPVFGAALQLVQYLSNAALVKARAYSSTLPVFKLALYNKSATTRRFDQFKIPKSMDLRIGWQHGDVQPDQYMIYLLPRMPSGHFDPFTSEWVDLDYCFNSNDEPNGLSQYNLAKPENGSNESTRSKITQTAFLRHKPPNY